MTRQIDLNSDLGEGFGPWAMGEDARMLSLVTSANIACGGHASDPETMFQTLTQAAENGVIVGAHPGYNDREGFGRRVIPMAPSEIERMVAAQIGTLIGVAALVSVPAHGTTPVRVRYVKPHGALANLAARDRDVARAIARAIAALGADLDVLAISGTALEQESRNEGLRVHSEIFADRAYQSNGQLVPRGQLGAVIHDARAASDRLLAFLDSGLMPVLDGAPIPLTAHSICVHGDSPGAVTMARQIRDDLSAAGVQLTGFMATS